MAWVTHKSDSVVQTTTACGCAIPTARGIAGGYAGAPNRYEFVSGSDVQAQFRAGRVPQQLDELKGTRRDLLPKETGIVQTADDVYLLGVSGAAGFGDPIDREPAAVSDDVANRSVTVATAQHVYGVTLAAGGSVDEQATVARREAIRVERRATAKAARP